MEEALYDASLYREFAGLDGGMTRLPDEGTILRFRHLLETLGLAAQMLTLVNEILSEQGLMLKTRSAVDATSISAPSSAKNGSGTRDPEIHQTKKGNQWYFGMKAHVGVDADSGLVHAVVGTAANVHDINAAEALLHGRKWMCTLTPDIRVSKRTARQRRFAGMSRCGQAGVDNWT
ncbi:transposase DDE domain protein [Paraburkholderia xenovorans LB400]|jgi:transposase, IS5 family|nr:transposase DDE domain protein [Paraburkholderia xenovorans LB400]